jgi:hypothetical protein
MRGLPAIPTGDAIRTRRWDAVILGGALPGLISAVLLGMRGARVLVVEEEAALSGFAGLREPFLLTGTGSHSVLGACLREIGVPLIEQRRIATHPLAYQVVLPEARLEVGEPARTTEELVAWGLAKPEEARALVRALSGAAATEREAMLAAPVVRTPRLRAAGPRWAPAPATPTGRPGARPAPHGRGLPAEVSSASPQLARLFAAQVRALSNLGSASPSPEARARLLGLALEGGTRFSGGKGGLRRLLRRRIESLHGEFRSVSGSFRLVSAANQPGIAMEQQREVWVGRALVLNAPRQALASALGEGPVPDLLHCPPATRRRLSLHFRAKREVVPEGMAPRVICVTDPSRPVEGTNVITLRVFPGEQRGEPAHLIASTVVPVADEEREVQESELRAAVCALMPFCEEELVQQRGPEPRWDSNALLADPPPGEGWPGECEVRLSSRPLAYSLERAAVAGLGFEGEVLLGWRAGEAIAADLTRKAG